MTTASGAFLFTDVQVSHQHRWLFTGGRGKVGQMVLQHWQDQRPKAEIIQQTRMVNRPTHNDLGPVIFWDILLEPFPKHLGSIDCLIGFAGVTPSTGSPLHHNRDLANATMLAAEKLGITRVLMTSSSAVYGVKPDGAPMTETDATMPVNDYGHSKVAMEDVCATWRDRGFDICCLRIGNVAGADALLLNAKKEPTKKVLVDQFTDGKSAQRSYLGPGTLARIIASLARHPGRLPEVLNIAAPAPVQMSDLAQAADLNWAWQKAPATAYQKITLDVSNLSKVFVFSGDDSTPEEMVRQFKRSQGNT